MEYGNKQIYFGPMVKKSQLKKYNVDKIMDLVQKETNGEQLKMFSEAINQKNKIIFEKKGQLVNELSEIRRQLQKVFREMNDGVKDRIQLKTKVVMDKNSRPGSDDIKEITEMFAHLENQHNLIKRNSHDLQQYELTLRQAIAALQPKTSKRADPTDLDEQYFQLNQQCARQQIVKQQLIKERQANRKHYNSISSSIQQYRIQYDFVEDRISQKQRELVQLTSYLSMRKSQDQSVLSQLRNSNMQLQAQLLKAQEILNSNSQKCQSLMIREIQTVGKQSL